MVLYTIDIYIRYKLRYRSINSCRFVLLDLRGWSYLKICISVVIIFWVVHLDAKI